MVESLGPSIKRSLPQIVCYQIKLSVGYIQSRFLGPRGCDEALFSAEKGVFSEKGGGNSVNGGVW